MSNHLDILQEARNRLEQCEKLDRTVPIDLPEMDQQQSFLKWAHVQIRAGVSLSQISIILCIELTVTSTLLPFVEAFWTRMGRTRSTVQTRRLSPRLLRRFRRRNRSTGSSEWQPLQHR